MCQDPGVDKTKPKRNLFDNANNLLTNLLSSGNLKNMPVAEGNEVTGSGGSKQEKKPSQIYRLSFLFLFQKGKRKKRLTFLLKLQRNATLGI